MATIKDTTAAIRAIPGMEARIEDDEWRVTVRLQKIKERYPNESAGWCADKQEAVAYYTGDAGDAVLTAQSMSKQWEADSVKEHAASAVAQPTGALHATSLPRASQQPKNVAQLAKDLSAIALGDTYSEKVVRAAVDKLQELRDRPLQGDLGQDLDRINRALVACKLALHGVTDTHHRLQDASVLIAQSVQPGKSHEPVSLAPSDVDDPAFRAQIDGLKQVTASINSAYAPELRKADFNAEVLEDLAQAHGMVFDGQIVSLDDGNLWGGFTRQDPDGLVAMVRLSLPGDASKVVVHTAYAHGTDLVLEAVAPDSDSANGGLGAGVQALAVLREQIAHNQLEAQHLVERIAVAKGASVADWRSSDQIEEWTRTVLTTAEGKTIRLGASMAGVVSVEGDPFAPDSRAANVTFGAVSASIDAAERRARVPLMPINTDPVLVGAPGDLGIALAAMCSSENRLAGYMTTLNDDQAVVLGKDAWFLSPVDNQLVLMRASVYDGQLQDAMSRFDHDLEWVDIEVADIHQYTAKVDQLADDFLSSEKSWALVPVDRTVLENQESEELRMD